MSFIEIFRNKNIATVKLNRGKVHALNEEMVDKIHICFKNLEKDDSVKSVILTGAGKFFSFGLDIPELYSYSKDDFALFLKKFTNLYTYLFIFPKPIVAAINGHAIAGGCMLANACDFRIMTDSKARISLNEITFGSSVFAGSVEILKFLVGGRNAEKILLSGNMYSAEQAIELGLIDQISSSEEFMSDATGIAEDFSGKDSAAFKSIKSLLRMPVWEEMNRRESESIKKFNDIWYSDSTRAQTKGITIRS